MQTKPLFKLRNFYSAMLLLFICYALVLFVSALIDNIDLDTVTLIYIIATALLLFVGLPGVLVWQRWRVLAYTSHFDIRPCFGKTRTLPLHQIARVQYNVPKRRLEFYDEHDGLLLKINYDVRNIESMMYFVLKRGLPCRTQLEKNRYVDGFGLLGYRLRPVGGEAGYYQTTDSPWHIAIGERVVVRPKLHWGYQIFAVVFALLAIASFFVFDSLSEKIFYSAFMLFLLFIIFIPFFFTYTALEQDTITFRRPFRKTRAFRYEQLDRVQVSYDFYKGHAAGNTYSSQARHYVGIVYTFRANGKKVFSVGTYCHNIDRMGSKLEQEGLFPPVEV